MDANILAQALNAEALLLSKRLEPLPAEKLELLKHVQSYPGVESFNEAEVRSFIIDPILRVLGYDKGTPFSSSLENPLRFLGQARVSDYQLQLWEENFWLLEAKRPRVGESSFGYKDFAQALEYSVHPTVNAALIVLCDGLKLEIFDREANVDAPVLHVDIKNLVAHFDKVRAFLDPMQIWFFQKRRVLRLLERVVNKEFVLDRVEELSDLLQARLRNKRHAIVENFRAMVKPDSEEQRKLAETASLAELTELYMMYDNPIPIDSTVNKRLVDLSLPNSFHVMRRVFPDRPRPANDSYMAQAVSYLIALSGKRETVEWMPAWLAAGKQAGADLVPGAKFLLEQCLSYFSGYEPYRVVLLAACAVNRIAKINAIANDAVQRVGKELHALARFTLPEVSWAQAVASPEGQIIGIMDAQARAALHQFVVKNSSENGFQAESAKLQLRGYWELEKRLLAALPNYPALLKERSLGEMRMIEWASVTYDNLGHGTLARLHRFPTWKQFLLEERKGLVEDVASTGSWAAREMLGIQQQDSFRSMPDETLAARFFLGDVGTLQAIRKGYRGF